MLGDTIYGGMTKGDSPVVRRMLLAEGPHEAAVVVNKNDIRFLSVVHSPLTLHQRVVHIPRCCTCQQ